MNPFGCLLQVLSVDGRQGFLHYVTIIKLYLQEKEEKVELKLHDDVHKDYPDISQARWCGFYAWKATTDLTGSGWQPPQDHAEGWREMRSNAVAQKMTVNTYGPQC